MSKNATSEQESDGSVDEQRARWERFSMTVLGGAGGGYVNVRNDSHGDEADAHIYSVEVEDGAATGCSCPHAVHRGAHCKHQVAVEDRPLVVSSAAAAGASTARIATDGGRVVDETCANCGLPLDDARNQPAGYTRVAPDGGEICGACADIRHGHSRVDGRLTLGELEERAAEPVVEPEVRG